MKKGENYVGVGVVYFCHDGEPHKFDAVEWFTIKNLPVPLHSQIPNFLKLRKDKLP